MYGLAVESGFDHSTESYISLYISIFLLWHHYNWASLEIELWIMSLDNYLRSAL